MQISFSLILLAGVAFWVAAGRKCHQCYDSDCNDESKFSEISCDDETEICFSAYYKQDNDQLFAKSCGDTNKTIDTCDYIIEDLEGVCYTCKEDFCNKSSNNSHWIS